MSVIVTTTSTLPLPCIVLEKFVLFLLTFESVETSVPLTLITTLAVVGTPSVSSVLPVVKFVIDCKFIFKVAELNSSILFTVNATVVPSSTTLPFSIIRRGNGQLPEIPDFWRLSSLTFGFVQWLFGVGL